MRTLAVLLTLALALTAMAGQAAAQVAAPMLNPAAPLTTTENPAVLQWSTPSRVTVGWQGGKNVSHNAAGLLTSNTDTPGWYVQGRAVGETFSIGVEHLDADLRPEVSPAHDVKETQVALAGQLWDTAALGVGQATNTDEQPGTTWKSQLRLAGASVRFFEHLYVGVASGSEQVSVTGGLTSDRAVTRYGIGWHNRGDSSGLHLEVAHEARDEYENFAGSALDRGTQDSVSLEVMFANILVGLTSYTGNVVHPGPGSGYDEQANTATLGWVPQSGLAIVLSRETRHRDFLNGIKQDREQNHVAVAWQF